MVVLLEGSPISTEELWSSVRVTIGFLVTSLTKALLPRLLFGRAASSRKNIGGYERLPFKNDGGHCVLGDLQCCNNVSVPFTRSVPIRNPVSELYWQFLQPHSLIFALTFTINCGNLQYTGVCPSKSGPIKWNLPQVYSNQVLETSQEWSVEIGCTWAQFWVS